MKTTKDQSETESTRETARVDVERLVSLGPAIHRIKHTGVMRRKIGESGESDDWYEDREVRVMAIAEGYVMARRKGCVPYVAPSKEFYHKG
jgi:hypothetical protein